MSTKFNNHVNILKFLIQTNNLDRAKEVWTQAFDTAEDEEDLKVLDELTYQLKAA